MKKILIIGASFLQVPAIHKAKEKGYYVGVVDYNSKAVGIPYADEYFNVSTIDAYGLLEVAKIFKPAGIMTMATDLPIRAISYVNSVLGLIGIAPDVAFAATDKLEMITRFTKFGVNAPWFFYADTWEEFIEKFKSFDLPIIIKPTDNSGSRGVVLVQETSDIFNAFKYSKANSRCGRVIIEQYITGDEVSVELFVIESKPIILAVTDKMTTNEPNFVEIGHSQPSRFTGETLSSIHELAIKSVKSIGIDNGPVHAEMRISSNGPVMIELGARMGGDCITSHLVPLSTGIDMVGATIDLVTNHDIDIIPKISKCSAIQFFYPGKNGLLSSIEGLENVRKDLNIIDVTISHELPYHFSGLHGSQDRVGHIIAQGGTVHEVIECCAKARKHIKYNFLDERALYEYKI